MSDAEAERVIRLALAPSTQKSYSQAVSNFNAFRCHASLSDSWPIPFSQMMQFCVSLKSKGLAVCSIRGKLAAFVFASKY